MIKGSIWQEKITIINVYARAPNYVKQIIMDLKREMDSSTIVTGGFKIVQASMDRLTGQKLGKETTELIQTLEQMALIDIYKTFHYTEKRHFHQYIELYPELAML